MQILHCYHFHTQVSDTQFTSCDYHFNGGSSLMIQVILSVICEVLGDSPKGSYSSNNKIIIYFLFKYANTHNIFFIYLIILSEFFLFTGHKFLV